MENLTRKALWQERVGQWRDSGLSQRAFALREGYPVRQMGYWVRCLSKQNMVPLLPVSVKPAPAMAPALVLSGPGGWSMTLPPGTSASWLAELLRSL
ncbi:hypothetical protein [Janthinobacterium sp. NKUCC06_STL]|uniref:IS66 family insertion sequence element accessory protein TnpA n=1 Tax=Janthinobacterium sp. NKUCC06_STL TaxID=2842127 RepID=UPI001C5BF40C|nr:hypothetical protein [Janthinobacterium sp. NKUCC06_STL]MBW3512073.1 hypothetical protein [Janthinobacterium sp. NKUCC06_STL]